MFDSIPVSLKCIDWYEFDVNTKPLVNENVYQEIIDTSTLNGAIDILNYILESQIFDVFITKFFKIYFGFEYRQALYIYPGLILNSIPESFQVQSRLWYINTRNLYLNQTDNNTFRVISTPYYDAGTPNRIVTISKAILAPSKDDTQKRYLEGKGRFMGVANLDIKIREFQDIFQEIKFYDSGYLVIVNKQGKLINEHAQFINQVNLEGKVFEDLDILQLLNGQDWEKMLNSLDEQLIQKFDKQPRVKIGSCKYNKQ